MIDRICKVDDSISGIVGYSFKEFDMEVILRVVDDELFVESDGRAQVVLQVKVPGFGKHVALKIRVIK